ncbi:MAG: prepilin-type N-terminal cleavage/methylation domain-containing protein [Phycisphaerae bacterium]|jgi:type II secretory pathway pseudopilin PulG
MKIKNKQFGLTIIELLVVIGIIAAVVAISLPAINAMQKSFDSTGAESMISAALSTARTLAISRQQYVGVRFQTSYKPEDVLDEEQYMIFIVFSDEKTTTNFDCGFMAVPGYKPMKLPENIGVIDKTIRTPRTLKTCNDPVPYSELPLTNFSNIVDIVDTTTFSIVFSPAGKLVIHEVRCRNNDQAKDDATKDTVFNTRNNIVVAGIPTGMFVEDYLTDGDGLGVEKSRNKFYIYDREKLRKMTDTTQRWDYIDSIKDPSYINPYTGGIIDKN